MTAGRPGSAPISACGSGPTRTAGAAGSASSSARQRHRVAGHPAPSGCSKPTDRGATWQAVSFPAAPSATGQGVTLLVAVGRSVYAGWGDSDGTSANLYRTSRRRHLEAVPGQPTGTAAKVPIRGRLRPAHARAVRDVRQRPGPERAVRRQCCKLRTASGKWTEVTPVKPGGTTADGSADSFGYGGVAVDARRPARSSSPPTTAGRWWTPCTGPPTAATPGRPLRTGPSSTSPRRLTSSGVPNNPSSAGGSRPSDWTRSTPGTSSTAPAPPFTAPAT